MYTLLHAIAGYFILLLIVRVLKRRPGAQMTVFEFVLVFLMGGIIILSTVGNDRSVTNCTCAIIMVGLLHRTVAYLKIRSPRFGMLIDGTPLLLYKHGQWQDEVMRGMKLAPEDVLAAARTKGLRGLNDIEYAILERNGGISIIKRKNSEA
jgi:uncharacterized membrane protein YcaP (DUF421 family)